MDIAAGDVIQVACLCRQNLRDAYNLWDYVMVAQAGAATSYEELATGLKAAVGPLYQQVLSENAEFIGLTTKRLNPLPVSVAFDPGASNIPGLITGDGMSRQTCGALTKLTQLGGKAFRGRAYIPYPSESANDADGNPTAGYKVNLGNLGAFMMAPITITGTGKSVTIAPAIWHKATRTYTLTTGYRVNPYWITQRRRARTRPS